MKVDLLGWPIFFIASSSFFYIPFYEEFSLVFGERLVRREWHFCQCHLGKNNMAPSNALTDPVSVVKLLDFSFLSLVINQKRRNSRFGWKARFWRNVLLITIPSIITFRGLFQLENNQLLLRKVNLDFLKCI